MITDIYPPIDDQSQLSLGKTQALLESDCLLAGLGKNCANYKVPTTFPVVTDLNRSNYLIASQAMWEDDAVGEDQYFEDINGAAVDRYERYEYEEVLVRQKSMAKKTGVLADYLVGELHTIMKTHDVVEHLCAINPKGIKPEQVKTLVEDVYINSISGNFMSLAEAAFFGGYESWPIAKHFHACFETGGIPTGWVGPLPTDGGVAQECMQLLHFGPQDKA